MKSSKISSEESKKKEEDSKFKKPIRSPLKIYLDYKARLKLEEENRLLKKEEQMKEVFCFVLFCFERITI